MDKIKEICERNKKPSLQNIISGEDRYTLDINTIMKEISIEFGKFIEKKYLWFRQENVIEQLFEEFNNSENK